MILCLSFFMLYAVKDPDLHKLHSRINSESNQESRSIKSKVTKFTDLVKEQLSDQPILLTCLIGSAITKLVSVLFSTYLILWI